MCVSVFHLSSKGSQKKKAHHVGPPFLNSRPHTHTHHRRAFPLGKEAAASFHQSCGAKAHHVGLQRASVHLLHEVQGALPLPALVTGRDGGLSPTAGSAGGLEGSLSLA